jgi:anthranilate synthase component 1
MNATLTQIQVEALARDYRIIPVAKRLFSGSETPLSVYEKLATARVGTFLLESADQGVWSRYSFVGVNTRGSIVKAANGDCGWLTTSASSPFPDRSGELPALGLDAVEKVLSDWPAAPVDNLPPLTSGLVGMLGWNVIREIENLPAAKTADYKSPDVCLTMVSDMVILDHLSGELILLANIFVEDGVDISERYNDAISRIEAMQSKLLKPSDPFLANVDLSSKSLARPRTEQSQFLESIEVAKQHVRNGDVFQVVLSQRFDEPVSASALHCYRVLRSINPSPYMYLLNLADTAGQFSVVGSSPEALVTVSAESVTMHPIAGSRPRGAATEEDNDFAASLLDDAKETSEHLMLVDLARNDLLKVCEADSVEVSEFMQIRRFSHIMHLVSTVEGKLREDKSVIDVFRATFPAGTLSGAPKPKALEIIETLEPSGRGIFGGVVGYFDFAGNADLAIAIRTAFIRDGVAHVQAGAGIVLDSKPESEFEETVNKTKATLTAIAAANEMKTIHD